MQTHIVKWGNSRGIRLPKVLLDSVHLADNDAVEITTENNQIIIKKAENKKAYPTIQERFKDFEGVYEPIDMDWGEPEGKEIW